MSEEEKLTLLDAIDKLSAMQKAHVTGVVSGMTARIGIPISPPAAQDAKEAPNE